MFKLLVATVAALYAILWIFGAEDRRVEQVARADSEILDISVGALASAPEDRAPVASEERPALSEAAAVRAALDAGKTLRAERTGRVLLGSYVPQPDSAPVAAPSEAAAPDRATWVVNGSRVNLRAGPGTGNDVVGQVVFGDAAHVLDERDGWYRIESVDGANAGWIFGKFLEERQQG